MNGIASASDLVVKATQITGLTRFHSDSYREGLELAVAEYSRCGTLTPKGRKHFERRSIHYLSQRLQIDDWLDQHPEAANAPVKAPVFIVGLPRTGSTLLVNLMALDPCRRPLWAWEIENVLPPPQASHMHDDPRIAEKLAVQDHMLKNGMVIPHFELADDPAECLFLLAEDFKSISLEHVAHVPGYRDWLYNHADMVPAYEHHKRALQVLQSSAPGRWLLKLPSHTLALDALFKVYPDARMIVPHRDPLDVVGSYCSVFRHTRAIFFDEKVPLNALGEQYLPQLVAHADRLMAYRDAHPQAPFHDLHYHDFKADPIGEIRRIYAFLGDELSPGLERKMLSKLAERPEQPFGRHDYSLEEFQLDPADVRERFGRYIEHYGVRLDEITNAA